MDKHIRSRSSDIDPRLFVLCFPHLGTLDNWLPIVNRVNDLQAYQGITLIIPNASILRSFHKDNAVIRISNKIFDSILIHSYDNTWVKHKSLLYSMKWYKNNQKLLRLLDILKRLIRKSPFLYIFNWMFVLLRNKIYKNEANLDISDICKAMSQLDILFYDIHSESNHMVMDVLHLFEDNNKYSLPHALSMLSLEKKPLLVNVKNKNNIKVYVYAEFQRKYYDLKYKIDPSKVHAVGIPRHDSEWVRLIQEKSPKLPKHFDNDNTIIILSIQVSNAALSFDQKVEAVKNIKKIFINGLGMKVVIKLHPNEKQERIFSNKKDKIYESVFGSNNYGITWIYSDLHVFALGKGKRLSISLKTGVIFDMVAIGSPCIEYIDLSNNPKESKKYITQFVKYGFVKGVSNYYELSSYVDKWFDDLDKVSELSMNTYKKYFPMINDISKKIADEVLLGNKNRDFNVKID